MKNTELLDYLGEIDDDLIVNAMKKPKPLKKKLAVFGTLAACVLLGVAVFTTLNRSPAFENSTSSVYTTGGASEQPSVEISEGGCEPLQAQLCYVRDGVLLSENRELPDEQAVFEAWKQLNGIGDEVRLIGTRLEGDSTESRTDISGVGVAAYHTPKHHRYFITVSRNLESYLQPNRELLLTSLKKTMTSICLVEPDQVILKFEE